MYKRQHFPDSDASYKGADSRQLLKHVSGLMERFSIGNLDATIVAQAPKMSPHLETMIQNISSDLGCDPRRINIKATTTERLGFVGKELGIEAHAVVLLVNEKDT